MTLQPLTLLVQEDDIGVFYQLLATYHQDRSHFVSVVERLTKGNDEYVGAHSKAPSGETPEVPQGKPQETPVKKTIEDQKNFYEAVSEFCDCGTCYNTFARPSRTPWRSLGNGKFVNAEYGSATITKCSIAKYSGPPGYIYVSLDLFKQRRRVRLEEEESMIRSAKLKSTLELEELRAQEVREKLVNLKDSNALRKRKEEEKEASNLLMKQQQIDRLKENESEIKAKHDQAWREERNKFNDNLWHRITYEGDEDAVRKHCGMKPNDRSKVPTAKISDYCAYMAKRHMQSFENPFQSQLDEIRRKIKEQGQQMGVSRNNTKLRSSDKHTKSKTLTRGK